jgi:predicted RNase H-like HicB family nuclease
MEASSKQGGELIMHYPVVIQKRGDSEYQVLVPDITGCITVGPTMEAALQLTTDTLELHIDGLTQSGRPIPSARRIEDHQSKTEFANGVWALIAIDISKRLGKSKRINITMPERLLLQIDKFTASSGGNRSGFLADAAMNYISRQQYHDIKKESVTNEH